MTYSLIHVKQLFDQVEPLTQAERDVVFAECIYATSTIEKVKQLLCISDEAQAPEITIIQQEFVDMSTALSPGDRIGAYKIMREIGRGGMGIVFLAERDDGHYSQQVAIKLLPSFAGNEEKTRFTKERQTLAELQHANIATLFDGGITDDERPYLVMEYISGKNIVDYIADKHLNRAQILTLFKEVCLAIQYAHRHLIIHKDIKPDNILVDELGRVKLLDFGISRSLTDNSALSLDSATFAFASPEQLRGDTCTTQSDIYSLGALLYTLFTGQSPHQAVISDTLDNKTAIAQVTTDSGQSILAQQPREHLSRLSTELKLIIKTCLQLDEKKRYDSVDSLVSDITAVATNKPISLKQHQLAYVAKKLISRHPVASFLTAGLSVAFVIAFVFSLQLNHQLVKKTDNLTIAKQQLSEEIAVSKQVVALLTNMFQQASPEYAKGETLSAPELVELAIEQVETSDINAPKVRAELYNTLSNVSEKIGDNEKELYLRQQAIALKEKAKLPLTAFDHLKLGHALYANGEYQQALVQLEKSASLLTEKDTSDVKVSLYNMLSIIHERQGDIEKAEAILEKAMVEITHLTEPYSHPVLSTLANIASQYVRKEQDEKALSLYEEVARQYIDYYGSDRPEAQHIFAAMAQLYSRKGDIKKQGEFAKRAYRLGTKYFNHNKNSYYYIVVNYTTFLKQNNQVMAAINVLENELNKTITNPLNKALYQSFLSGYYLTIGENTKAYDNASPAYAFLMGKYKNNPDFTNGTEVDFGLATGILKDNNKGNNILETAFVRASDTYGKNTLPTTTVLDAIAKLAFHNNELDKAKASIDAIKAIYHKFNIPLTHPAYMGVHHLYGLYHLKQKNWQQAFAFYQKAQLFTHQQDIVYHILTVEFAQAIKQASPNLKPEVIKSAQRVLAELPATSIYVSRAKKVLEAK